MGGNDVAGNAYSSGLSRVALVAVKRNVSAIAPAAIPAEAVLGPPAFGLPLLPAADTIDRLPAADPLPPLAAGAGVASEVESAPPLPAEADGDVFAAFAAAAAAAVSSVTWTGGTL
jgi:hypothetical protein